MTALSRLRNGLFIDASDVYNVAGIEQVETQVECSQNAREIADAVEAELKGTCTILACNRVIGLSYFMFSCSHSVYWVGTIHPNYCPVCGAKVVDE